MKVVITQAAYADLIDIGDYIARDNPTRAITFVDELEQRCRLIRDHPEAAPVLPDHRDRAIRRAVHGRYCIFYRIRTDMIEILHVLNAARDIDRLLLDIPEEP
jgi:plasmid stabilization system protein ParE